MSQLSNPLELTIQLLRSLDANPLPGMTAKRLARELQHDVKITRLHLHDLKSRHLVRVARMDGKSIYRASGRGARFLHTFTSVSSLRAVDWDIVHKHIQKSLTHLAAGIDPAIAKWKAGRTSSKTFPLFSYLAFDRNDLAGTESILAGVLVAPGKDGGFVISADISGDESGKIWFEVPSSTVGADRLPVLLEAMRQADSLREGSTALRAALSNQP